MNATKFLTRRVTVTELTRALRASADRHNPPFRAGFGWSYTAPVSANGRGLSSLRTFDCRDYYTATQQHRASVVTVALLSLLGLEFEGKDAQAVRDVVGGCDLHRSRMVITMQALCPVFRLEAGDLTFKLVD